MSLVCRRGIQFRCLCVILRYAVAVFIAETKVQLAFGIVLFRCEAIPLCGFCSTPSP